MGTREPDARMHATTAPAILDRRLWFPDAREALAEGAHAGLVAIGGDLSVPRLVLAYRSGLFPWTDRPLTWWSPEPRAIFELDQFHAPRRLRPWLRPGRFEVTTDRAFPEVIRACAARAPGRERTWISPAFQAAYSRLHLAGWAHSLELWDGGSLVGGVYGVAIGGFFAGESMFHRVSNASKIALYHLVEHLRHRGYVLFDIQMLTPLTQQMGATQIPRETYLRRLEEALERKVHFDETGP